MNNIKKILAVLLIVISTDIISQPINEIECKLFNSSGTNDSISNPFGGVAKPNRTDLSGGQQARFLILIFPF